MGYMLGLPNFETTSAIHPKVSPIHAMFFWPHNSLGIPRFPRWRVQKAASSASNTAKEEFWRKRSCVSTPGERVKPLKQVRFETTPEVWQFCEHRIKRQPKRQTNCYALRIPAFRKWCAVIITYNTHQRQSIDDDVKTVEAKLNNSHCNTFLKPISYRSVEFWGRNKHSINSIRSISWSLHDIWQNWVPHLSVGSATHPTNPWDNSSKQPAQPPGFFAPRIQVWSKSRRFSAFFFRKSRTSSWSICTGSRFVMGFMFWDGQAVGNHKELPKKKTDDSVEISVKHIHLQIYIKKPPKRPFRVVFYLRPEVPH